jgi:hypothetical protein
MRAREAKASNHAGHDVGVLFAAVTGISPDASASIGLNLMSMFWMMAMAESEENRSVQIQQLRIGNQCPGKKVNQAIQKASASARRS